MRKVLACLLLCCLPWAASARTNFLDGAVAYVNERAIAFTDVLDAMAPQHAKLSKQYRGVQLEAKLAEAYTNMLDGLIEHRLIVDAYANSDNKLPDEAVSGRVNEIMRDKTAKGRGYFRAALEREGMSLDDWKAEVRDQIVASYLRNRATERRTHISPVAVRQAYRDHLERYRVPEKLKLRLIVVSGTESKGDAAATRQAAADLHKRLSAGADFAALAKESSADSKAADGGDWGWVDSDTLRPELSKALLPMRPGGLSDVLEVAGDCYLLKLEGRQAATVTPFEEVCGALEKELKEQERASLTYAWVDSLKKRSYVKIIGSGLPE